MRVQLWPGQLCRVVGHSMAPRLKAGELVVVDEGAYRSRDPRRGELVAARPASLDGKVLVKRVVGLPHERVRVGRRAWTLGGGEFFLLGEQPDHSLDSQVFGPVNREELVGSVRRRLWPWRVLNAQGSDPRCPHPRAPFDRLRHCDRDV